MKAILILIILFYSITVTAQPVAMEKQEDKIDYYAHFNDKIDIDTQKDKYRKVANITGNTTFVLLIVTAFSFANISVPKGNGSPNYRAVSTFFIAGYSSCILGTIALIYNGKAKKNYYATYSSEATYRWQNIQAFWSISGTENGIGLVCTF